MNIEKYRESYSLHGMPCYKYIIRNLQNQRDILVFEKAFVENMLSKSFSYENINDALCLFPNNIPHSSPIFGMQFNILGNGIDMGNLIDSLCMDFTIPSFDTCKSYCKKYDIACTICQFCMFSNTFKNQTIDEERTIIRYIFDSADNYDHMKSLGIKTTLFRSVTDITETIASAKHPVSYTLYRNIFKTLKASADKYYQSDCAGHQFSYRMRTKLAEDIFHAKLPTECYKNDWHNKLVSIWEEDIFSTPLCTAADAEKYLTKLLCKEKYTPPAVPKIKTSIKNSAPTSKVKKNVSAKIIDSSSQVVSKKKDSTDQLIASFSDPTISKIEENFELLETDINNEPNLSVNTDSKEDVAAMAETTSTPFDKKQHILNELSLDVIEVIDKEQLEAEPYIEIANRVVEKYDTFPSSLDMSGNLIYTPIVPSNELDGCAICLDTKNAFILTKFESAVLYSKRMAIEVVKVNDGRTAILMWIPSLRTYFYSTLQEPMSNQILFPLLSQKSIIKITYSPYWLYSLIGYKNGGRLKQLESIQTMHYLLSTEMLDYISVLLSYGVQPSTSGIDFKSKVFTHAIVFRLMPWYPLVYRKQIRRINATGQAEKYYKLNKVNEAIGISYDMRYWLGKKSFLYTMPHPFIFKFNKTDIRHISASGYIITYDVDCIKTPPESIIYEILYNLSASGRLRNLDMQIIEIFTYTLVVFVTEECFLYASEIISNTLFDVAEGKSEYGITFTSKHIRIEHGESHV